MRIVRALALLSVGGLALAATMVDQENVSEASGIQEVMSLFKLGQTLTPGITGRLVTVEIAVARQNAGIPEHDLTVEIHADLPGPLLGSVVVPAAEVPQVPAFLSVDFLPERIDVQQGVPLGIVTVTGNPFNSAAYYAWSLINADPYAGGAAQEGTGGEGFIARTSDRIFRTTVDPAIVRTTADDVFAWGKDVRSQSVAVGTTQVSKKLDAAVKQADLAVADLEGVPRDAAKAIGRLAKADKAVAAAVKKGFDSAAADLLLAALEGFASLLLQEDLDAAVIDGLGSDAEAATEAALAAAEAATTSKERFKILGKAAKALAKAVAATD